MLKKTKFYVGLTLIVQSVTFFVMFIMLFSKKKTFAGTLLAISSAGGLIGVYLVYKQLRESAYAEKVDKAVNDLCDLSDRDNANTEDGGNVTDNGDGRNNTKVKPKPPYIPVDDTVNEDEFKEN